MSFKFSFTWILLLVIEGLFYRSQQQPLVVPSTTGNVDQAASGVYDHTLHVVISAPTFVIDEFGTSSQMVTLDGTASHTHQPNAKLVEWEWKRNDVLLSTQQTFDWLITDKSNNVCLTIYDNNGESLTDCQVIMLVLPCDLPGTEVEYFPGENTLNQVTEQPLATEFLTNYQLLGEAAVPPPFLARFQGSINFNEAVAITLSNPTLEHAIWVDGALYTSQALIPIGIHKIDLRVKVTEYEDLPVKLVKSDGTLFNTELLIFDATGDGCTSSDPPSTTSLVINSIVPSKGTVLGGTVVTMTTNKVETTGIQVLIDGQAVQTLLSVNIGEIKFAMPPSSTAKDVKIQFSKGGVLSNFKTFTYTQSNPKYADKVVASGQPFAVVEYCYGYLFAVEYGDETTRGIITQYKVEDDYSLTALQSIKTVNQQAPSGSTSVLGLVCDPFMNEKNFNLYVHHAKLYQTAFFSSFPIPNNPTVSYKGYVSALSFSDGFATLKSVITGLPVSNRDHSVNGGCFLDNQTLLIAVGGMTNQGYPGKLMGGLPESPLSGAILQAKVRTSAFPFNVKYEFIPNQKPNAYPANADPNNAIYGDAVKPTSSTVSTYATGMRNPFDCVCTVAGKVFCTDNGSNPGGYGDPMTGCSIDADGIVSYVKDVEIPQQKPDEVNDVIPGQYYGHPNMARVRAAGVCNIEGTYVPGDTFKSGVASPTATVKSSTDGIIEFVSNVFDGDKRGQLFACKYKQGMHELTPQGKLVTTDFNFPCLSLTAGPGGAIYAADLDNDNVIRVRYPDGAVGAFDVFPYRATGDVEFILSGEGFVQGTTVVKFGSQPATDVKVISSKRITGKTPFVQGLVDVTVQNGGSTLIIPKGYKGL